MDKVSIITPCYNASKFLQETYNSLQQQTYSHWEWIIVDDCSTDSSVSLIKQLQSEDQRVILVLNDENSGAAVTRNNSLNHATGDYCAFLDADDLWETDKLEKQLLFMKSKDSHFSYHDYWMIDASGKKLKKQNCPNEVDADQILKYNPFATSSIMIKRETIEKNQIRFKAHLRRRQDYIFWHDCLLATGRGHCLNEELSLYRVFGDDSLSANKKEMAKIQWRLLKEEFGLNIFMRIYSVSYTHLTLPTTPYV